MCSEGGSLSLVAGEVNARTPPSGFCLLAAYRNSNPLTLLKKVKAMSAK